MGYVLYNRLGSGGFVIEAAMALAGIDLTYEPLPSTPDTPVGALVSHLNPWGQVPILKTADGEILTELAAILIWLTEREPAFSTGPNLWIDNRAAFLRWAVFMSVNIYEGILRQSYPERYADTVDGTVDRDALNKSIRIAAKRRTHDALRQIEQQYEQNEFFLGARLSVADIFLAMLYAWHNEHPDFPRCTEITTAVATHPIMRPIWQNNFSCRLDRDWTIAPANRKTRQFKKPLGFLKAGNIAPF